MKTSQFEKKILQNRKGAALNAEYHQERIQDLVQGGGVKNVPKGPTFFCVLAPPP